MYKYCACVPCIVQIGRTLVFESLDQAATYRQYVCKTLRGSPADIVTLCGNKLSGRGVVLGSGFKVVPVEQAPCRFGTIPRGQQVGMCAQTATACMQTIVVCAACKRSLLYNALKLLVLHKTMCVCACMTHDSTVCAHALQGTPAGTTQCEAAAESLIEALQQQEDLAHELQQAHAAAQQPEQQQLEQQRAELQQQLRQLETQIKQQQRSIEGSSRGTKHAAGRHEAAGEEEVVVIEGEGGGAEDGAAAERQEPDAGRQQRSKRRRV